MRPRCWPRSTWLGFADGVASIRPYPNLSDLWDMVARSAYTQLRYSPFAVAGTVVGLVVVYLGAFVSLIAGLAARDADLIAAGAAAWVLMTASYVPMIRYYRLPIAWTVTLPFAAVMYAGMTLDSARRHYLGRAAAWKGRTYAGGATA